ncbi:MAG: 50S ribosomal protein L18 [Candidatus Krumholzibacteriota bacterium]
MSDINKKRRQVRLRRKVSIRKKLAGTPERPRVSVTRSHKYIYAQVIDDEGGNTMLSSDSRRAAAVEAPEGVTGKCAIAYSVGRAVADLAKEKGIAAMVFDRNGYLYHGRVAALARGLRDGGIEV